MKFYIYIVFCLILNTSASAQSGTILIKPDLDNPIYIYTIRVLNKNISCPDSIDISGKDWETYELTSSFDKCISQLGGINWIHKEFEIADTLDLDKEISLNLWNIGEANEIYWDGKLIGKSGKIGIDNKGRDNLILHQVKIPFDQLSLGTHNLLIKFYNNPEKVVDRFASLEIGYDRYFIKRQIEGNYVVIVLTVILFVLALFYLIMFLGFHRNISYLLIAIFCLANAFKSSLTPLWIIQNAGIALSVYENYICTVLFTLGNHSLLAYFILKFEIKKLSLPIAALVFLSPLLIIPFDEKVSQVIFFILSYMMIFYGAYKKNPGSIFALSAISGFAIWNLLRNFSYIWQGYFIGVIFFSFLMLFEAAKEIASQIKLKREANLRSARLENELLKRNIQPHFILNTLTALQEVVEQDPPKAVKLIQSLADEFRLFSKVSDKKLIPISEELEICKAHLDIMEYRKGAKYTLIQKNINGDELIPPGIFHTVIENGITHGFASMTNGNFEIRKENGDGCVLYSVINDGTTKSDNNGNGTGLNYIETRLEESFPGKWKLLSYPTESGWKVEIKICDKSRITK